MRLATLLLVASLACESAEAPASESASGDAVQSPTPEVEVVPIVAAAAEEPFLLRYDFEDRLRRFDLPGRLDEISGLAFTSDGRLFAHDDERGRVHQIDPLTGEVGMRFDLGPNVVRDDFEGIAIVGERFFLVSSTGRLYEFREGADDENVPFRVTDTGVGRSCEVEGLDYDPEDDALLIACKIAMPDRGEIVIHRLPVSPDIDALSPIRIPKVTLGTWGLDPDFDPSAIAVTSAGSWLLLSGRHDAVIEVNRRGSVVAAVQLSRGRHPQSEGLAIGPDGTLYISDEKNGKEARLTAYGPR